MDWKHLAETVSRMAGFLLLQNLDFHRPWWSDTVFGGDTQSMSLTILSDSSADQCSIGAIEFEIFVPIMVTTSLGLVCLP